MGILSGEIDIYGALESLDRMPHQKKFVGAQQPNAAYVGGQGSGKSVALCTAAILNCYAEPGGFSLMGRLNMPALETTTMKTFLEMVPEGYGEWAEAKKTFTFTNRHQVIFKHLDVADPKVVGHIRSLNLSGAYVDEATEIKEEVYFLLLGRLRRKTTQAAGLSHKIRLASNPAGHDWIWRHFFDPNRKPEWRLSNLGITASTMDNPFLPREYVQNMLNTYPQDWADRFIYGSFSDFSDLVYKEFAETTHTWNPRKNYAVFGGSGEPPHAWPVIIGIDIGSDIDPWAVTLDAISPWGSLFQYAEVYGNSMLIADIARQIKDKVDGRKIAGIAYDYSNRQCALELAEHDINGQSAIKEVEPGLFKMAQYYHLDLRLEHPFDPGCKGAPRAFTSQACINSVRENLEYKWAKDKSGNPTGEPSHESSHSPDARRYSIHTFRPLPEKLAVRKKWENPALDPVSREYWKAEEEKNDKMKGFVPRSRVERTMQDWQKLAGAAPKRFQRPGYARFARYN